LRTEPLIKWNVLPNRCEECTALNDFKTRIKLSLQLALRTQHNVKSVVNEIVGWRQPVSNCGMQSVFTPTASVNSAKSVNCVRGQCSDKAVIRLDNQCTDTHTVLD